MRRIAFIAFLFLVGCDKKTPDYNGKVVVEKIDGKVVNVILTMPYSNNNLDNNKINISKRQEMEKLIEGMDSLLIDMKAARDQMPVVEEVVK